MKKFLSILIGIALVLTCSFSNCQIAFADETPADETPRIELQYSVQEEQILAADETYTAEVWLYNVENVKSGEISLNGQTSKFGEIAGTAKNGTQLSSAVIWNEDLSYSSKAFETSITGNPIAPMMATDKITFSMKSAINVGSDGRKLATITVANTTAGKASLSFGGWGMRGSNVPACILKDDSKQPIYSTNNQGTFDVAYTWATSSEDGDEQTVWDSTWNSFRGNAENNAVVNYETPKGEATTALKWISKQGIGYTNNVSPALLIGDYVYVTSTTQLLRINKTTGEVEKTCELNGGTVWNTVSPAYGTATIDGKEKGVVFVSLVGGKMQAVDAKTMNTLWISKSACTGENKCPILYDANTQLVYTGYWSSESGSSAYVCFDAKTGHLKWKHEHKGGFFWAGGLIDGDYLIVGSDNGDESSGENSEASETNDHALSTLYVFEKQTGEIKDSRKELVGDQRSTIVKYNNKYYFTTKGGYLYKAEIDSSGKIASLTGKSYGNGQSTSTPVIHNGRVYFGLGGGFTNNGLQHVIVADADSLNEIYRAPMPGYPQGSGLLSTAYSDKEDGKVYIYFTYNCPPGGVTLLKDQAGQTEPDVEALYVPGEGLTQYCLSSVVADTDGTLYFHNDSGALFALEKNEAYLENITLDDNENRSIELLKSKDDASSKGFSQGYLNYYAVAEESASSVTFRFTKPEGVAVKINNRDLTGETFTLNLTDSQEKVNIEVKKGNYTRTYQVTVKKASADVSLSILGLAAGVGLNVRDYSVETVKNAAPTTCGLLEPNLSPEGSDYTLSRIHFWDDNNLRLDIRPKNSGATFKLRAQDKTQIRNGYSILDEDGYFLHVKKDWQYQWTDNYGTKDEKKY